MVSINGDTFIMRQQCPRCDGSVGYIVDRGGQNCVYCVKCDQWLYNAPKSETGQPQRKVNTRPGMKPSQRLRIIERANGRCELCGATPPNVILHVDHILSVCDGELLGMTETEINHDENLCCLCEECNLGKGKVSFSPRIYVALVRRRMCNDA
jgi:hypothetical protein